MGATQTQSDSNTGLFKLSMVQKTEAHVINSVLSQILITEIMS